MCVSEHDGAVSVVQMSEDGLKILAATFTVRTKRDAFAATHDMSFLTSIADCLVLACCRVAIGLQLAVI